MIQKKTILLSIAATVALALAVPAGAAAAPDATNLAVRSCKAQKKNLGKAKFERKYGAHAMRTCIQKARRPASEAIASATSDCNEELALYGPTELIADYERPTVETALEACVIDDVEFELGLDEGDGYDDGYDDGSDGA
jgi:hypothetical protein